MFRHFAEQRFILSQQFCIEPEDVFRFREHRFVDHDRKTAAAAVEVGEDAASPVFGRTITAITAITMTTAAAGKIHLFIFNDPFFR